MPWLLLGVVLVMKMKNSICISSERKTLKNIMLHGAFIVSMSDASFLEACDYLGNETGNEVPDKFARAAGF